jgi:hypothetical protein
MFLSIDLIFPSLAEILQSAGSIVKGCLNLTYHSILALLWNADVIVWNTMH